MSARQQFPAVDQMTPEQFKTALADPMWRLENLYYIKTKSPKEEDEDGEESDGVVVKFKPNRAQKSLLARLHYKNLILKARQLGFTTLIQILFLDFGMFTPNLNIGIIAHTDDAAKKIFKKIKFAYERLPEVLRLANPLTSCSVREMTFKNGSTITVGTSMRGDTIHYLHISEYGKICAKFPDRAEEVVTGTMPAVPDTGMIFIESTAEGRDGDFFKKSERAESLHIAGTKLTNKQFRFHFFPWHEEAGYTMNPEGVVISPTEHEYFDGIEAEITEKTGKPTVISLGQRAWWVATRDDLFGGLDERMWQEYPSTPKEAFQKSAEGTYYRKQFIMLRKDKRITRVPYVPGVPVNTFWDIGNSDGTAIWFHQRVGMQDNFIRFMEGWGEPYASFVKEMEKLGYVWGSHYLPHDGAHVRQGQLENLSPQQMLERLGLRRIEIVPVVAELQHGISATRDAFATCWFDAEGCKEGLDHLEGYKKKWNDQQQCWSDQPVKNIHTEGADSFRQFAQAQSAGMINSGGQNWKRTPRSWKSS